MSLTPDSADDRSDSTESGLRITNTGDLLTITLARPERRNAQTPAMWRQLAAIAESLPAEVQVVLINAEGPSFSAGLDRRMLTPEGIPGETSLVQIAALPEAREWIADIQRGFTAWRSVNAIVVCAVQGHAVGAGFQLALAADLVVAADNAAFAMKETTLGLVPDLGGTSVLLRTVGYQRALEICLTGRTVGADEALALGLVTRVVPVDDLAAASAELVESVRTAPWGAARALKRLLATGADHTAAQQVEREREEQVRQLRAIVAAVTGN